MKQLGLLLLLMAIGETAYGHAISMSSGFATVQGNRVEYILRMPQYEMAHIQNAERTLFQHIRFTSGGEAAKRLDGECHSDAATSNMVCAANYQFSAPVERLGVECSFHEITVPNHIHMLHAERNGKPDQAILDSSFPSASLAFRPPTAFEIFIEQAGSGARRAWSGTVQLLLLAALAIAARRRRELLVLGTAFAIGECAGTYGILQSNWQPTPRFAESAVALALAYLALENIAFPESKGRWVLALVFGAFEGMYFSLFVAESGFRTHYVLGGAVGADLTALGIAGLAAYGVSKLPVAVRNQRLLTRIASGILMVAGLGWFFVRLNG